MKIGPVCHKKNILDWNKWINMISSSNGFGTAVDRKGNDFVYWTSLSMHDMTILGLLALIHK